MMSLKVYFLSNLKVIIYCFFKNLFNLTVSEKDTMLNLTLITYRLFIITYRLTIITYPLTIITYQLFISQDSLHSN